MSPGSSFVTGWLSIRPVIYTGSIGHSMNNIFKSPDKPFYNSAVMMTIDVIEKNHYLATLNQASP